MPRQTARWSLALFLVLLVVFACMRPAPRAAASAAANQVPPNVLVYCDGTPGTILEAAAIGNLVQTHNGQCTFASSAQEFAVRLSQPGWTSIHVLLKKPASEPPFAAALRAHAIAHPEIGIELFIWKPHSCAPASNEAVLATSALVTWRGDWTSVTYALARSAPETTMSDGLNFPTFEDVAVDSHVLLFAFEEAPDCADAAGMFFLPPVGPCVISCYNDVYAPRIAVCNSDFDAEETICQELHGPPPGGGVGDPEALEECIQRYTGFWQQCRAHALSRYKDCVKKCSTTQPAQ